MDIKALCRVAIACLFVGSIAVAQPDKTAGSKPSTETKKPDDKKADDKKNEETPPILQSAVDALATEMESLIKDPKNGTRREKSDYFATSTDTVDPEVLLKVLNKRLNKNPLVDSYIKWQLLSIQKGQFADAQAKPAASLYRKILNSPLQARPGVGADAEMNSLLLKVKKEEVSQANQMWQEKLTEYTRTWGVVLAYRDELYSRLPRNMETISLAFADAEMRMQKGIATNRMLVSLGTDMRTCAAGLKPVDINRLVGLTQQYAGKTGMKTYTEIIYDEKAKRVSWKNETPKFDKGTLDKLATDLNEMAKAGF